MTDVADMLKKHPIIVMFHDGKFRAGTHSDGQCDEWFDGVADTLEDAVRLQVEEIESRCPACHWKLDACRCAV